VKEDKLIKKNKIVEYLATEVGSSNTGFWGK
jgi:hypothetical protein